MDKTLTQTLTQHHNKSWTMNLQPIHWALLGYYAKRRNKTRSDTLRELIEMVAERDKTFDVKGFKDFVLKELIEEERDPDARDVLRAQVEEFAHQRITR
jgi:macrodomain Ter protein organizer (MatP/YcbG family)